MLREASSIMGGESNPVGRTDDLSYGVGMRVRLGGDRIVAQISGEQTELDIFLKQFGENLAGVEEECGQLRDRYAQVTRDRLKRQQLGDRIEVVRPELDRAKTKVQWQDLNTQLKALETQMAELDVSLESRLFAESGFNEVFWQAVRFGGLGVVIGWLLARWVG